jgi:hypothetical protein
MKTGLLAGEGEGTTAGAAKVTITLKMALLNTALVMVGILLFLIRRFGQVFSPWLHPGNHSLRSAIIGSTAEARLAGKRHAMEPTPSSSREAASRIRGLAETFSIH